MIVDHNRFLVAQRGYGEFKDLWEFPGGKVELNEQPEETIIREIKEELNADIIVDALITNIEHDYNTFHLSMELFACHLNGCSIELLEHEASKWITAAEMDSIDFLPADRKALPFIKDYFTKKK